MISMFSVAMGLSRTRKGRMNRGWEGMFGGRKGDQKNPRVKTNQVSPVTSSRELYRRIPPVLSYRISYAVIFGEAKGEGAMWSGETGVKGVDD